MRNRATVAALLLLALSTGPAAAEGSTVLYGPTDGHRAIEIATSQKPVIAAIYVDEFDAGPATLPSFIGSLQASQYVFELGPALTVGRLHIGAGVRAWISRLEGTQEYLYTYWTDATGHPVSYEDAHDGFGNLLPGYQEHNTTATRKATADQDSATELAVLAAWSVESGSWIGSAQASYAASGLAWKITGGYRWGDVVATIGYRAWPMERFYRGPVMGVELRF